MTIPRINAARLWADLMALGKIGAVSGQGVTRTALSDADLQAKDWLLTRMHDAGLETSTDAVYNLSGRLRAGRSRQLGLLAVGSHLDSVPQGGPFDGVLGHIKSTDYNLTGSGSKDTSHQTDCCSFTGSVGADKTINFTAGDI